MKLKIRLTVIFVSTMVIFIAVLAAALLSQARKLQIEMAQEIMEDTTGLYAKDLEAYYAQFVSTALTLAELLGNYEDIEPQERRRQLNEDLSAVLRKDPLLIALYSVWKPGVLDGMDERYRNTRGSDKTGNFVPFYTRESGRIELRAMEDYETLLKNLPSRVFVGDPAPRELQGETVMTMRIQVPIANSRQEIVGIVGVEVDMSYSQTLVGTITPYNVGRAELYSTNGTILAGREQTNIGRRFQEVKRARLGTQGLRTVETSLETQEPMRFSYEGTLFQCYPFHIGDTPDAWLLITSVPLKTVLAKVDGMTLFALSLTLGAIVLSAAAGLIAAARLAKPITEVSRTLKDISEGEGDLTKSIVSKRKDEVGDLAHYFNLTLKKIRDLVATIKEQAASLSGTGGALSAHTAETAAAINEITATIQTINGMVIRQSAGLTGTNAAMEQITLGINKLNEQVAYQTDSMAQSSSAIEEMLANIQSVTATLVKNSGNMRELIEASDAGRSGLQEVVADTQEIARESEGLLEINTVMENIAGQTDLLSMNAAIEAAHAGEAGKGFAVVAGEIRKLAESSGEQSKTIALVLKKIKNSIDKITTSTGSVLNRFEAIDGGVRTVSDQENTIRSAMEEQNAGSRQILEAISRLKDITRQVREDTTAMLEKSGDVTRESKNLEQMTAELSGGMREMAAGADEINSAMNQVNEICEHNRENIDILTHEVSRFRIEA